MPTQYVQCAADNTARRNYKTKATAGAGGSHYLYIGRNGSYDYDAFLRFVPNWAEIGNGKIISATLVLYQSDQWPPGTTSPIGTLRVLTDSFSEGVTPGGAFVANEYTWADSHTTVGTKAVRVTHKEVDGINRYDVLDALMYWAPTAVTRKDGKGRGTNHKNYGFGIYGTAKESQNFAVWSRTASNSLVHPQIEIEYEYGTTIPDVPTNLTPAGDVVSLETFQGDFFDSLRSSDTLRYSEVEVYYDKKALTSDFIGTDNIFHCTNHGLSGNDVIYFVSLSGGKGVSTYTPYYVIFSGISAGTARKNSFKISTKRSGAEFNVTDNYTAGSFAKRTYGPSQKHVASALETSNFRFDHVPTNWAPKKNTQYWWRARVYDQEDQISPWTGLVQFSVTNTAPHAPFLQPVGNGAVDSLDGQRFEGGFSDDDPGDFLLAAQVQASPYAEGDINWEASINLLWDTGKAYVPSDPSFSMMYGGMSLSAGVYHWRARVWDNHDAVSPWSYGTFELAKDFVADPGQNEDIVLRPHAPWRIVIKAMGTLRGPGATVGVFENAKSIGASIMYNSPGELHFTLPTDDPQISVCEPKQTHYSVQFYSGDGWREVFAGLLWDADANETDVVFYGIDYLALFDYTYDEHYDPNKADLPAEGTKPGVAPFGSFYTTRGYNSIGHIIRDQLDRAIKLPNSPVGFITIAQTEAVLKRLFPETVSVYSTFEPTLSFVTGLLDSHKQGGGTKSRIVVRPKTGGGYEVAILENPGQNRDNLRLRYGELVQGYRVILFGTNWGSRMHAVGRDRNGFKVRYDTELGAGMQEEVWGRFGKINFIDGISDGMDLIRRTKQMATANGKLGRSLGLGIRTGFLQPLDGYNICDYFPVSIHHGAVNTDAFAPDPVTGVSYWACMGIAWEALDQGQNSVILTLLPKENSNPPSTDLIDLDPISPQAEWQIGWTPPDPFRARSGLWLDQTTGIVYTRVNGRLVRANITGDV